MYPSQDENNLLKNPIAVVVMGIVLYVAFKLVMMYKAAKSMAINLGNDVSNSTQVKEVKKAVQLAGIADVRAQFVLDSVDVIYNAFYNYGWGFLENEQGAIDGLNSLLNISEAKAVASIYKTNFKKSLNSDFIKFCTPAQLREVKPSLLFAIKSL